MWTYKCDRCGAALDPGERCDCQDRPVKYNGKPIFTQENFNYSEAKIGDYVEQAVVDDAMDCLPPASMSAGALRWANRTPTGRTRRPGGSGLLTTRSSVWLESGLTVSGNSVAAASRARPSPVARTRSTAERGPPGG